MQAQIMSRQNNKSGFTMIELLMGMSISLIAMAAIYGVFVSSTQSNTIHQVTMETQQNVRLAMDMMVRDIRMAGLDPERSAGSGFQTFTSTDMKFTADRNMDGSIDSDSTEEIEYIYDSAGTQILQCVNGDLVSDPAGSCIPIADDVSACTFTYLDSAGNPAVASTTIATIVIAITVTAQAGKYGNVQRDMSVRIRCRNMGLQ